ncbi:MAG: TatD family hydrolase [Thermoproteota archaeon]|nr:TatD family hydrolase [Thermoproteota archaeon]MDQ3984189.1 TatD family hydrolase [Thermoproteota archaeon]
MTRLFDPHIHMYSRTTDDYDAMSKAGIEVIVQPSFWLGSPRRHVGTFEDYWEHMITFETKRAKEYGIEHFVCISVNPKEAIERPLALDAVDAMLKKGFLDRERAVAVGELGYNLINDLEEEVFVKQMDIAAQKDMLMTIHLPHKNKQEGMKRIEKILLNNKDENKGGSKYKREKILVDHNVEETIEKTLELGMWAGLSVYPVTKLSPERTMKIIKKYGTERIMIHSAADWGISDPLSVPLVARDMRKSGEFSINDIEKVTFYNAYEYYKQSDRFNWKP